MAVAYHSLDGMHDVLLADYRGRLPEADASRLSDNWKRLRTVSLSAVVLQYLIRQVEKSLLPTTAEDIESLRALGSVYGVTQRGATPARRASALRVFGTPSSTVSIGNQLTHVNGLTYQVNKNATVPAAGYVDVDIVAVDIGSQTKLAAGETLTFVSAPSGVAAQAELQLDLDQDGADEESMGEFQARLINRISQPGMGGNANDYRYWGLESDASIASVYVYPLRRGRGSVDIAALHVGSGSARLLTSIERAALYDHIESDLRPVAMKSFRVLEVTTVAKPIEVRVAPRPGAQYAFDWDASGGHLVSAWDPDTRVITLQANRPSDMQAGDRIVIKTVSGDGTGEQYEIEALGPGSDEFSLARSPSVAPVNNDEVLSGGGVVDAVRDAIAAHVDSLGPAVGQFGTGEWDSDLDPARIHSAFIDVPGVYKAVVDVPSTTYEASDPPFPTDSTIELVTYSRIIVEPL